MRIVLSCSAGGLVPVNALLALASSAFIFALSCATRDFRYSNSSEGPAMVEEVVVERTKVSLDQRMITPRSRRERRLGRVRTRKRSCHCSYECDAEHGAPECTHHTGEIDEIMKLK